MPEENEVGELLASLRVYLENLRESGVDGLPVASAGGAPAAAGHEAGQQAQGVGEVGREALEDIRAELGDCHRCRLGRTRTTLVFGVGNPRARLVFVGEAPGGDEDLKGEPFVGEAGQLLNRVIIRMGLKREDVYICNVLKCRPPGNRNPERPEIEQCGPFMLRQVKSIAPEAVVALGTFASQTLLETKAPISKLRGHFHDYHGIPLMPTFHPSYLLHNRNNTDLFWLVWEDMVQVLRKLNLPVPEVKRKG